jgi:hypothetical protein
MEKKDHPERPNFVLSAETQAIIRRLETAEVGRTITYQELCLACGSDPLRGPDPIRGSLETARRRLQRTKNYVFAPVTGIGLQRLSDSQVVPCVKRKLEGLRRGARRAAQTLACADFEKLSPTQQTDARTLQAQTGAIQLASSLQAERQIEQRIIQGHRLEVGNIQQFFKDVA